MKHFDPFLFKFFFLRGEYRLGALLQTVAGTASVLVFIGNAFNFYMEFTSGNIDEIFSLTNFLSILSSGIAFLVIIFVYRLNSINSPAFNEYSYFNVEQGHSIIENLQIKYQDDFSFYRGQNVCGVSDIKFNALLIKLQKENKDIPIDIDSNKFTAYSNNDIALKTNWVAYLFTRWKSARTEKKIIHNDRKIRLRSQLTSETDRVTVCETDYASSIITDNTAFKSISIDDPISPVLYNDYDAFLRKTGDSFFLLGENENNVSNQIGASIFGFTKDGAIVFVQQTRHNMHSGMLLAPTGSGSFDWDDLKAADNKLISLVAFGGAREMHEESGINKRNIKKFAEENVFVYAYTRLIHRAGKPEFFALAKLDFRFSDAESAKRKGLEKALSGKIRSSRKRISRNGRGSIGDQIIELIDSELSLEAESSDFTVKLSHSYQVSHGLLLLKQMIQEDDGAFVHSFFDGHFA